MQANTCLQIQEEKREGNNKKQGRTSLSLSSAVSEGQGRERNGNEESVFLAYRGRLGLDTRVGIAGCAGSGTGSGTGRHKRW